MDLQRDFDWQAEAVAVIRNSMRLVAEFKDFKRLVHVQDEHADENALRNSVAKAFPEIPDVNSCLIQVCALATSPVSYFRAIFDSL